MITNHPYHINAVWKRLIGTIIQGGNLVEPRGKQTQEVLSGAATINMDFPILTNIRRKAGLKFMAAEAYWILSGSDLVEHIAPYCEKYRTFSDDGETLYGAYGPRWRLQREYILDTLKNDQDSRQAVAMFWKPNPVESKDIPCSLSAQWIIRHEHLHCILNMRSSDLWLGFPYDIFTFTMLTHCLMWHINVHRREHELSLLTIGNLYYSAGSMHIYVENIEQAVESFTSEEILYEPFNPDFTRLGAMMDWLDACRKGTSKLYVEHIPATPVS